MKRTRALEQRFWSKVDQSAGPDGCWPWSAARNPSGYGMFGMRSEGRVLGAHRVAYELTFGSIADGLQLDHLCHTNSPDCFGGIDCEHRRCVNPTHLEPVTRRENLVRSRANAIALNRDKDNCPAGHRYTDENTRYLNDRSGAHRRCRTCDRQRKAEARARARNAA